MGSMSLLDRIASRSATIGIIGQGVKLVPDARNLVAPLFAGDRFTLVEGDLRDPAAWCARRLGG